MSLDAMRERNIFEKEMSNTAHQREAMDLKAAGINRLLTAGGSGASTPSGGSPSFSTPSVENEIGPAITSAMEAKRLSLAMDKQKEELENMKKSGVLTDAQTQKAKMETAVMKKDLPKAELMNEAYEEILRPAVKGLKHIKGVIQGSPKTIKLRSGG